MEDENHHGADQQQMDGAVGDVEDKSQEPASNQDNGDKCQHKFNSFMVVLCRAVFIEVSRALPADAANKTGRIDTR